MAQVAIDNISPDIAQLYLTMNTAGQQRIKEILEALILQQAEEQERKIHLTSEDMQYFFQALENPPKANVALKEAAKWHKHWIKNA